MPSADNAAQEEEQAEAASAEANEALDDEVDDDAEEEEEQAPPPRDVEEQAMFASYRPFTSVGRPHPAPLRISEITKYAPPFSGAKQVKQLVAPAVLSNKGLSNAQLDAVAMASARLQMNRGFLIADSTGTGKGREALGVALNELELRASFPTFRVLYVSVAQVYPVLQRVQRRSASCHCTTRAIAHHVHKTSSL